MNEGAERIVRRILDDARARADGITGEASREAAEIKVKARQTAAEKKGQILARARKDAAEQKRRILGATQLNARKEMLAAKQELIEEAFRRALEELSALEGDAYFSLLRKMIVALAETGAEKVVLSERDRSRLPGDFLQELNRALSQAGKKGEIALSDETRDIKGGFILQTAEAEINCSFEALLEAQRDELEPAVARVLFA